MSDITPVIPGMKHAGWHCKHDPFTPGDEHTEWAPRRKHGGWKRKKRPGVIGSITPADSSGDRPDEPGCLKARPLYELVGENQ